jgi:hypothetical protein
VKAGGKREGGKMREKEGMMEEGNNGKRYCEWKNARAWAVGRGRTKLTI